MEGSKIYIRLKELAQNDAIVRSLLSSTEKTYKEAVDLLKMIPLYMRQHTLHDQVHVDSVIELMGMLLPDDTFNQLKPLELACLILSASLHDIGMVASPDEVSAFRDKQSSSDQSKSYQAFRETYPPILSRIRELEHSKHIEEVNELEDFLTSEYLRREHGIRCRRFIFGHFQDRLVYGTFNFTSDIVRICESHSRNINAVQELPCSLPVRSPNEKCNFRFAALLLRLADILDFDAKRTPQILFENLGIRDKVSLKEWKKHLAVSAWNIQPGIIAFTARCPDPVIEKTIRDFIDLIDMELRDTSWSLSYMHDPSCSDMSRRYYLKLPNYVCRDMIGPEQDAKGPIYDFVDLGFHLDRDAIVSLVLGFQLYADRSLFLRELLQNSLDTCRHRLALHNSNPELGPYEPWIKVNLCTQGTEPVLIIEDNGMGMDEQIVRSHFARVGNSYYKSHEFRESKARQNLQFDPISEFGIGILSSFMATNRIRIETRRFADHVKPLDISIDNMGALFWFRPSSKSIPGTKITLPLTESLSDLFPGQENRSKQNNTKPEWSLKETVARIVSHADIPIEVISDECTKLVSSHWILPKHYTKSDLHLHIVDLNLTEDAPAGINGIAKVFILHHPESPELVTEYQTDEDVDGYTRYIHQHGYIEEQCTFYYKSGDDDTSYSSAIESQGRWSQRGITVNSKIFPGHYWDFRPQRFDVIPFPFPFYYDIDLSGDFVLPLSADRNHVLRCPEAKATGCRIAEILISLLLKKVGSKPLSKFDRLIKEALK